MRNRMLSGAIPLVILLALPMAIGACEAWESTPLPPVQSTVFQGRVVGPEGTFVHAAEISLSVADPERKWMQVDLVRTSSNGTYSLRTPRSGRHRILATAAGCIAAETEIDVPVGVASQICDFELAAALSIRIEGMLLSAEGLPLSIDDVAFLFPAVVGHEESRRFEGTAGAGEYFPFSGGSSLVARYTHRGTPPGGELIATIAPETGRFEIEASAGFAGALDLDFRGRTVSSLPWRDGGGLVEYEVDVEALRATLCEVELQSSVPAAKRLRLVRRDVPPEIAEWSAEDVALPARLRGIPVGDYTVVADLGAGGLVASTMQLEAGANAQIALLGAEPADVRFVVEDRRSGRPPLAIESCALRTPGGVTLPCEFTIEPITQGHVVHAKNAVPGDCVFFAEGAFVPVRLAPGMNSDENLLLADQPSIEWWWPLASENGVQLPVMAPMPSVVAQRVLLLTSDSAYVVLDAWSDAAVDVEGSIANVVTAPPGEYRLILEVAGFAGLDEYVEFDAGLP